VTIESFTPSNVTEGESPNFSPRISIVPLTASTCALTMTGLLLLSSSSFATRRAPSSRVTQTSAKKNRPERMLRIAYMGCTSLDLRARGESSKWSALSRDVRLAESSASVSSDYRVPAVGARGERGRPPITVLSPGARIGRWDAKSALSDID
jgi:hypothetical protein